MVLLYQLWLALSERKVMNKNRGWKAYGDPNAARRHFAQLSKCTAVYLRLFHSGTPISRLAVAA